MMDKSYAGAERRKHPRHTTAAAFWITHGRHGRRLSAWMTDRSDGGAAMLVAVRHRLRVGDRVQISGIYSADVQVVESTPAVPRLARVVRVENSASRIREVALRFETEVNSSLQRGAPPTVHAAGVRRNSVSQAVLGGARPSLPAVDIYPSRRRQAAS